MLSRVCLGLLLLAATPVWCQLGVIPYQTSTASSDDSRMLTPPPVSGEAYPTIVGSEIRSNYLATGLIFNTSHTDNVLPGGATTPVSDIIYSILPTITINQSTPRRQLALTYSPGFTFYQQTSALNAADQTAALNFQYRLSQHTTISILDSFQKSSNVFNQLYPLSGAAVAGPAQSSAAEVIAPSANRLSNTANVGLSYQLSRNGMIGAGGVFTESSYTNPTEASGFYNSSSRGGSVFYSQRLSSSKYIGVTYQYVVSQTDPVNAPSNPGNVQTEVKTHTFSAFCTFYLSPTLSLSVSGGPQYSDSVQPLSPPVVLWAPSVAVSFGWQKSRTNVVASFSRTVSGDTGVPGAFDSYNLNTSVRWRIARTWTVALSASYLNNKNVAQVLSSSSPGGQTVSGIASVRHSLSEHLSAELRYVRLHQNYSSIAAISAAPDSNSEAISISYQLSRPLGR